jgi:hypothetical protein
MAGAAADDANLLARGAKPRPAFLTVNPASLRGGGRQGRDKTMERRKGMERIKPFGLRQKLVALAAISFTVLAIVGLIVAQQAQCQTLGTLSGSFSGKAYDQIEEFPIDSGKGGQVTLILCDPYNATIKSTIPLTTDEIGNFQEVSCPSGQYRILINAHVSYKGPNPLYYYGFYNGSDSPRANCFADSELVTVTAGQDTVISSQLVMDYLAKTVVNHFVITGIITGTNGDPEDPQVVAMDACSGDVLGTASINKIIIKNDENPDEEPVEKTTFSFDKNCVGPVRLHFLSTNYPPEFYGADGEDNFSRATPLSGTVDLGQVVLGTKVPNIEVSPTAFGFGEVTLLDSRTQTITVSNSGSKNLVVDSVAFEGSPVDFSLFSSPETPFTLAPGTNQAISITYSPRAMGDASAMLAITSNDPDTSKVVVSLTGTGVASQAPADEQVSQIADVIQTAIATGTLTPTMPGNQATQLIDQIFSAKQMAAAGKSAAACAQLKNALQRVDGNPIPPDFLDGPDRELVRQLIQNTIESVGCK